ncbi:MAG: hypothetical protein R3C11_10620 [Planctomycetaceae bacterium]
MSYTVGLILAVIIAVDYVVFHRSVAELRTIVQECDGGLRSILDWPLGKEFVIPIDEELTPEQIKQLERIQEIRYRWTASLYLNYEIEEEELKELQERLQMRVYSGSK